MKYIKQIIFLMLILFINPIYSLNKINNENQLQNREQKAMQLYSEINNISEIYGRFITVRDKNLLGENGIQEKYQKCYSGLGEWINNWGLIFASLDLKNKTEANILQVQVQNMLMRQASSGENLKQICTHLKNEVNSALQIINNSPQYDASILNNYKDIINQMEIMRAKLIQVLKNYAASPIHRMEKLENLVDFSRKASLAKMRIELLNNSKIPLERTLEEFKEILQASKITDESLSIIIKN